MLVVDRVMVKLLSFVFFEIEETRTFWVSRKKNRKSTQSKDRHNKKKFNDLNKIF